MDAVIGAAYRRWQRSGRISTRDLAEEFESVATKESIRIIGELHNKLNTHGAPQRLMMQRQMIAELEGELRKRDAREEMLRWREEVVWANALPGVAAPDWLALARRVPGGG